MAPQPTTKERLDLLEFEAARMRVEIAENIATAQEVALRAINYGRRLGRLESEIEQARAEDAETALWLDECLTHIHDRCEGNTHPHAPAADSKPIIRRDEI